jgi:hypothetical protein
MHAHIGTAFDPGHRNPLLLLHCGPIYALTAVFKLAYDHGVPWQQVHARCTSSRPLQYADVVSQLLPPAMHVAWLACCLQIDVRLEG